MSDVGLTPGPFEFSADEEKAMRQSSAANRAASGSAANRTNDEEAAHGNTWSVTKDGVTTTTPFPMRPISRDQF